MITQFPATWPADVSWPDVTETQVANTFHWVTTLYCLLEKWSHKKSFCLSKRHLLETALRQFSSRSTARMQALMSTVSRRFPIFKLRPHVLKCFTETPHVKISRKSCLENLLMNRRTDTWLS